MKKILLILFALSISACSDSSGEGSSGDKSIAECGTGTGEITSPLMLCSEIDLAKMVDNLSAYYELGSNITLTNAWTPVGSSGARFSGSLDGNGFTIYALHVDEYDYVGLFGYIENAYVKNLNVELAPAGLSGNNYVAGIAGRALNSYITKCKVTGNVTGKNYVAGIIGRGTSTTIALSNSTGEVNAAGAAGGIAGEIINNSVLLDSYSLMNVNSKNYSGGIVGSAKNSTVERCYSTGNIHNTDSASTNMGGIIGSAAHSVVNGNMALNPRIGGQRNVGRIAGESLDCAVGLNYGIDMAIWGTQDGGERGTTLSPVEAATKSPYTEMGWSFGGTEKAPWLMSATYPVIEY